MLSFVLSPLVNLLQRLRLWRVPAVAVSLLIALGLTGVIEASEFVERRRGVGVRSVSRSATITDQWSRGGMVPIRLARTRVRRPAPQG
jgi:hypothetical protein